MSDASGEQIVGTVIGATIGFFTGGPMGAVKGAYIGYGLGTAFTTQELDPIEGPRLDDRKIQTSEYGEFIPRIYNTEVLSGNVFWVEGNKIKETKKTETVEQEGGKGGTEQEVTTYHYSVTMAVGLCEGPITGIRRIWADEVLIYDMSDTADLKNISASLEFGGDLQIYLGTETQDPSATIEAEKGAGNVPAFRGLAYVILNNFQLEKYGNRIPNLRFEVVDNALSPISQSNFTDLTSLITGLMTESLPTGYPVDNGTNAGYERATYPYLYLDGVFHSLNWSTFASGGQRGSLLACYDDPAGAFVGCDTTIEDMPFNYFTAKSTTDLTTYEDVEQFDSLPWDIPGGCFDYTQLYCWQIDNAPHMFIIGYESIKETPYTYYAIGLRLGNGKVRYYRLEPRSTTDQTHTLNASYRNGYLYFGSNSSKPFVNYDEFIFVFDVSDLLWRLDDGYYSRAGGFDENNYLNNLIKPLRGISTLPEANGSSWGIDPYGDTFYVIYPNINELRSYDEELNLLATHDISALNASPYAFGASTWSKRFAVRDDVLWVSHYNTTQSEYYLRKWQVSAGGVSQISEDSLTATGAGNIQHFVVDLNYNLFLFGGEQPPYVGGGSWGAFLISTVPLLASSTGLTLPQVIGEEMSRIDIIDSGDYDTSGLTADTVRGYMISTPGATSALFKPLQQGFRFDAYEEDYKIKFRTRGTTSSRVTITQDDLRAHEPGSDAPPQLTHQFKSPNAVPGRVEIVYKSTERDKEKGFAYADRLTLDREAITKLDLPLVLSADEAYQAADILLLDAEREGKGVYQLVTNYKYSHLVKTDIITVTADWGTKVLRITDIEKGEPGLVKITGVEEVTSDYSSSATGDAGDWPTQAIPTDPPSKLWFLDIPQLRAGDDDPGVYWGVSPIGPSADWSGATLYKSQDEGTSWDLIDTTLTEVKHGIVETATDGTSYTIFTYDNPITVTMITGVPETKTETQVRNGANLALYGKPGAWEILKFITATSLGNDQYQLNGLLRGQFGTDWAMEMHTQGDQFVILDKDAIRRLSMTEFNYSTPNLYLPITIGNLFDDAYRNGNTSSAVAKIPHAPEHVKGYRDSAGELTIEWIPRGRYNFQWANVVAQPNTDTDVFEIEILDGSNNVLRTLTSTAGTHSVTYTAAQQVTDFGSTQASITVRVYQQSDLVTRGYPREADI